MSVERSQKRWQFLTNLPILSDSHHGYHKSKQKSNKEIEHTETVDDGDDDIDPFSCNDLIVPSSKEIIDDIITNTMSEWQELDDRKIIIQNNKDGSNEEQHNNSIPKRIRRSKISLPKNFDYTTSLSSPPTTTTTTDDDNESEEEKIICLTNPNINLNYSTELYKLFVTVPAEEEIQIQRKTHNTHKLKKEIEDAIKEYTRVDCHSLSRLRLRSLHHLPLQDDGSNTVVRIECWNRMLKRGSSPDSHRFEAEFLCSSPSSSCATLLDVHKAILKQYSSDTTTKNNDDSGLFFIENTFYVHGPNHEEYYTNPILSWLNEELCFGNNNKIKFPRKEFLGISFNGNDMPNIKPMSSAYLSNVDFRLAARYVHFCCKTIESIFLFSDIRTVVAQQKMQDCNNNSTTTRSSSTYPRIIDTFTRTYANTICQGCNHSVASVVCDYNDEFTTGECTFMCTNCYYKLHYDANGNLKYNNYNVYSILDLELAHYASSQITADDG